MHAGGLLEWCHRRSGRAGQRRRPSHESRPAQDRLARDADANQWRRQFGIDVDHAEQWTLIREAEKIPRSAVEPLVRQWKGEFRDEPRESGGLRCGVPAAGRKQRGLRAMLSPAGPLRDRPGRAGARRAASHRRMQPAVPSRSRWLAGFLRVRRGHHGPGCGAAAAAQHHQHHRSAGRASSRRVGPPVRPPADLSDHGHHDASQLDAAQGPVDGRTSPGAAARRLLRHCGGGRAGGTRRSPPDGPGYRLEHHAVGHPPPAVVAGNPRGRPPPGGAASAARCAGPVHQHDSCVRVQRAGIVAGLRVGCRRPRSAGVRLRRRIVGSRPGHRLAGNGGVHHHALAGPAAARGSAGEQLQQSVARARRTRCHAGLQLLLGRPVRLAAPAAIGGLATSFPCSMRTAGWERPSSRRSGGSRECGS